MCTSLSIYSSYSYYTIILTIDNCIHYAARVVVAAIQGYKHGVFAAKRRIINNVLYSIL